MLRPRPSSRPADQGGRSCAPRPPAGPGGDRPAAALRDVRRRDRRGRRSYVRRRRAEGRRRSGGIPCARDAGSSSCGSSPASRSGRRLTPLPHPGYRPATWAFADFCPVAGRHPSRRGERPPENRLRLTAAERRAPATRRTGVRGPWAPAASATTWPSAHAELAVLELGRPDAGLRLLGRGLGGAGGGVRLLDTDRARLGPAGPAATWPWASRPREPAWRTGSRPG